MNSEILTILAAVVPISLTALTLGMNWIKAWERAQEKRDAERISAIVALHFKEKLEEMKETYAEVISMIAKGDLK